MTKVHNFSAGPGILPQEVLKQAAEACLNFDNLNLSLLEISHRSKNYEKVMERVLEVREKDALRAFQSPVRGDEIMTAFGLKPGKQVGIIKSAIEDAILEGTIPNEYEAAFKYMMEVAPALIDQENKG